MSRNTSLESRPVGVNRWNPIGFDPSRAALPLILAADAVPIIPDLDLWDCWPVETRDGGVALIDGAELWFFLSAPRFPDPGMRHGAARLRLVARDAHGWHDRGPVLDPVVSPGSREWAGSAVLDADERASRSGSDRAPPESGAPFRLPARRLRRPA